MVKYYTTIKNISNTKYKTFKEKTHKNKPNN